MSVDCTQHETLYVHLSPSPEESHRSDTKPRALKRRPTGMPSAPPDPTSRKGSNLRAGRTDAAICVSNVGDCCGSVWVCFWRFGLCVRVSTVFGPKNPAPQVPSYERTELQHPRSVRSAGFFRDSSAVVSPCKTERELGCLSTPLDLAARGPKRRGIPCADKILYLPRAT